MTGQHPGRTPIRDNREIAAGGAGRRCPAPRSRSPSSSSSLGYVTGAMGKWGLGPPGSEGDPLRQGFDRFFGYNCQRHAHNYYPTYLYDDGRRVALDNPPFRCTELPTARTRATRELRELRGPASTRRT